MKINKVLFQIIMLFVVSCSVSEVAGNVIFTSDNSHALTWHNVDVDGRRSAVFCIYPDSRGIVWVGTSRGLFLYDGSTSRRVGGKALSGSQIYAIVEYADRLYIGTNHGLKVYDCGSGKTEEPVSGDVGEVRCMSRKDSHLFVGGLNGVYCMDLRSGEMKNISSGLPHSSVYSLLIDSRGVIYAGTYAGLARYDAYASRFYKVDSPVFAKSSKSAFVNCMVESKDGHTIYVGTGEGLYTYQPSHERWGSVGGLSGAIVKSIARNASGEILVGTSDGLYYDDAGTLSHYKRDTRNSGSLSGDQIWCVMTDKDDNIWLGTEHGMSIASNSSVCRFIKISSLISLRMGKELSNNYVNSMVADKDGNLWILIYDDSNIYRYNVTGKKIRRIDVRKVSGGMPSHMCLDSRGRLWCAYDGGVLVIDRNGGTVDVKFPHTGDDAAVLTMAPVGTGVWVFTLNNMWNIDGNTLVPSAVPVPRYAFMAIWDDAGSGKVILGALDEIVEVDKASLSKAQEIGTVRLVLECPEGDDIRLNNLVGNPAGLSVAYDKNVSLLVSTLDYSPDVVQHIEYRLVRKSSDGSEEWIAMPEGAGMISLTGMSPGDYDIQIKTVGSPQSPVVIPLRVGYPYYLSVWAVSLYVLLLLSVIGCILWYVRRRGMRRARERERAHALMNVEKKLNFLSAVSHELKTPLSLIMGPVSVLKEKTDSPRIRHTLDTVYTNAVKLNNMIHRILEMNRLEDAGDNLIIMSAFDAVSLCESVFDGFRQANPDKKFIFIAAEKSLVIETDIVKFESIITNWPSRSSYFGIVDLAGLPKDRYYLYRSLWNRKDHTLHLLPHWNWKGHEGEKIPVFCYTDYPVAELFVNCVSQGKRSKDLGVESEWKKGKPATPEEAEARAHRYRLMWNDVVYTPGELKVVAYDANGNKADEKTVLTAGEAAALKLSADRTRLKADGDDLCFVTVSLVDKDGNEIPTADDNLTFEVTGAGHYRAACNGDATSLQPFTKPEMRLFSGKLVVVVQASDSPGTIILNVKDAAKGLSGSLAISVI